MPTINKSFMRIAVGIHTQLTGRRTNEPLLELPVGNWERCYKLVRQIRRARLRGWNLAATALSKDLDDSIPSVQQELASIHQRLSCRSGPERFATASDIYGD